MFFGGHGVFSVSLPCLLTYLEPPVLNRTMGSKSMFAIHQTQPVNYFKLKTNLNAETSPESGFIAEK